MGGELGINVKEIIIGKPYILDGGKVTNDISIVSEDGSFLHICGDNNVEKLMEDALTDYKMNRRNK